MRRAVHALTAIAAVEVAAALVLLPWNWEGFFSGHGDTSVFLAIRLVGFVAGACLLLFAAVRERRTRALGLYFLLMATLTSHTILVALFAEMPPQQLVPDYLLEGSRLVGYLHVPAYLFAPAFLWVFARECPRVHRRGRLDDLARRMVPVSVAIGCAIWIACAAAVEFARAGHAELPLDVLFDASLATIYVFSLGAVGVVALCARSAPPGEAKRVMAFSFGFAVYMGAVSVQSIVETFSPGSWLSNYRWSPGVVWMEAVRFPGLILLWYSVLAARVPHPRELVRVIYRWPLTHSGLLGATAAVPAVALGFLVASRPERAAGAIMADPVAQIAVRDGRARAAGASRPREDPEPPGRLDRSRTSGPGAGPGRCGSRAVAGRAADGRHQDGDEGCPERRSLARRPRAAGRQRGRSARRPRAGR